ncbi:MAG: hypothetical protein QXN83_07200 [Nitrososphaerales archaeon]
MLLPLILLVSHVALFVAGATIIPARPEVVALAHDTMQEARDIQNNGIYWDEVLFYMRNNGIALMIMAIPDIGAFISHITMVNTGGAVQSLVPYATPCKELQLHSNDCSMHLAFYIIKSPHAWLEFGAISLVASGSMMFIGLGYPADHALNRQVIKLINIRSKEFWKETMLYIFHAYKAVFYFFIPWKWCIEDKVIASHELKYLLRISLMGAFVLFLAAMTEAYIT